MTALLVEKEEKEKKEGRKRERRETRTRRKRARFRSCRETRKAEKSREHKRCINASRRRARRIRPEESKRERWAEEGRERRKRKRNILEPRVLCTVAPITMVAMLWPFLKQDESFKAFRFPSRGSHSYRSVRFNRDQRESRGVFEAVADRADVSIDVFLRALAVECIFRVGKPPPNDTIVYSLPPPSSSSSSCSFSSLFSRIRQAQTIPTILRGKKNNATRRGGWTIYIPR